jgi:hypothetical protein
MDDLINNTLPGSGFIPTGPSVDATGQGTPISTMPNVNIGPTDTLSTDSSDPAVLRRTPIGTAQSPMLSPSLGNTSNPSATAYRSAAPQDPQEIDTPPSDTSATDTSGTITTGNITTNLTGNENIILGNADGTFFNPVFGSNYVDFPSDIAGALTNQLVLTQETIDSQISFLKSLPGSENDPETQNLINILTKISEAIGELQEVLREMQSFNSEAAMARSQATIDRTNSTLEATLEQIKEMGDQRVESAKKEQQLGSVGLTTQSLSIIITCLLIIAAIPLLIANPAAGAVVMTVLIAVLVDQSMKASGMEEGLFDKMMDGIDKMFEGIADEKTREALQVVFKSVVIIAIVGATAACSPMAAATVLPSLMEAAGIGAQIAKLCGADEDTQQWVEFGLTCAVMLCTIVVSFKSGAGKLAADAAEVSARISERVGRSIMNLSDRIGGFANQFPKLSRVLKEVFSPDNLLTITTAVAQVTEGTMNYKYSMIQRDITLSQGGIDAEIAAKDAIVAMLKDIIKKLLDSLQGISEAMGTLNSMSTSMYRNLANSVGYA